jgi:hypothetical protein
MTGHVSGRRVLIARGNIAETTADQAALPAALAPGEALFRIDRVALTANNVTYAAAGNSFGYWRFFPGPDGFGILPVWGFATVVDSAADGLAPGDRFYGYWPLASHLVVAADKVGAAGFYDASPHRQCLSDFYNQYARMPADRGLGVEGGEALFRPLFMTGWLIDRFLADADDFGAAQILLSSASSKTAMATAFNLSRRQGQRPQVIGLTSAGNADFVRGLGCYDAVVTYSELAALDATRPTVFVDFAGDRALTAKVHGHFGAQLMHSAMVGMTHWDMAASAIEIPGTQPVLFFAPSVAEATVKAMGAAGFQQESNAALAAFLSSTAGKLEIEVLGGLDAAADAYRALAAGRLEGARALVVEPN